MYAWNSALMAETDISRSLVNVGREFAFPIYYLDQPTPSMENNNATKLKYSNKLHQRLGACREVYKILIKEH